MSSFSQTLKTLLAIAAARMDVENSRRGNKADVFEFRLLAAADQAEPELPASGWLDLSRLLRVTPTLHDRELHLQVQAQGYAALRQVSKRHARLVSADGLLNLDFGFDSQGAGLLVLANSEAVRRALGDYRILLTKVTPA